MPAKNQMEDLPAVDRQARLAENAGVGRGFIDIQVSSFQFSVSSCRLAGRTERGFQRKWLISCIERGQNWERPAVWEGRVCRLVPPCAASEMKPGFFTFSVNWPGVSLAGMKNRA
jgi:hypothetical protein